MSRRREMVAMGAKPYKRRVAYLTSSGTQYLTLGIVPYTNEVITMDVQPLSDPGGWLIGVSLFGRRNAVSDNNIAAMYYIGNGYKYVVEDLNNSSYSAYRNVVEYNWTNKRIRFTVGRTLRKIDDASGTTISENAVVNSDTFTNAEFGILKVLGSQSTNFVNGIVNLYGFSYGDKINLIPVVNDFGDGEEGCMFNTAYTADGTHGQQFYRNAGTGAFTWGEISAASNWGGYKLKCPRRSYRRSSRPSARFCALPRWEVAA